MITRMPTNLKAPFALFLPTIENSIELAADAKTINDIDDTALMNLGKCAVNPLTFSACEADGLELNTMIQHAQIYMGMIKRIRLKIDSPLRVGKE